MISQQQEGRYDEMAEEVLKKTKGQLVLTIVMGGEKGDGFSVATLNPVLIGAIPSILKRVANQIEYQLHTESNK